MNEEFKYIDEEEKEIIEIWENVDFSKLKNDKENLKELKKAARKYFEENNNKEEKQTITLRIPADDLQKIKTLAAKKGLSYQTFIKSILHQIAEDVGSAKEQSPDI